MNKMITETRPDTLHRGVKMALDNGEADSARGRLRPVRQLPHDNPPGDGPSHRGRLPSGAAALTMVNCGRRALLGGVEVLGDLEAPAIGRSARTSAVPREAVVGARRNTWAAEPLPQTPLVWLGDGAPATALQVTFSDWRGGVFVVGEGERLAEGANDIPAAVLAGALAAAGRCFSACAGNPMAGDREVGLRCGTPGAPWRSAQVQRPGSPRSKLWVLGFGHPGQAFLWVLGLLPFDRPPADVELTLQDFDRPRPRDQRQGTLVLTRADMVGQLQTSRDGGLGRKRGDPGRGSSSVALPAISPWRRTTRASYSAGSTTAEARAALEEPHFDLAVDAGLAASAPREVSGDATSTLPGEVTARARWGEASGDLRTTEAKAVARAAAYQDLAGRGLDDCGLLEIASRTAGVLLVGVIAATPAPCRLCSIPTMVLA